MRTLLIAFAMLLGTVAHAQESTLPKNVEQAFKTKYPAIEIIDSYEDEGVWIVMFQEADGENTGEAYFKPNGEWIKTYHYADESILPESLRKTIGSKYKGSYYSEVRTTEDATGTYFEITIDTDTDTFYIKADKTGKVLVEKKL